ncbi:hypothetical protein GCM10009557_30090 [Virgisporangium ochraceum]|uniref:Uncharacterized protein n=1 Tax=Virgisporangium ochraceum TaxID=65505 RepID=A0A8J3ZS72_9ACTN|nr:hypothetical protein [Virgisporangium ochraceum]GIJ67043.1 hypothetical protein Voc01_019600 [Virgisporangium ochraceum]
MTDLSPKDYAYLFLLKLAGGEIDNKEMERRFGIRLVSPDYITLNNSGLVESQTPRGRSYRHRITRQGEKLLDGKLEIKSTKFDPLARVLPMLHDLFREAPPAAPDDRPLHDRVRAAYPGLAGTGEWVRLADLRTALADVSRDDLDRALSALHKEPDVRLEPEVNGQKITPADRSAALRIGGEDRHKLAIGMP